MNSGSSFRWRFWPLLSGFIGLGLVLFYGLKHPEILAVREALICQGQEAASSWPGWHKFLTGLLVHVKAVAAVLALFSLSWLAGSAILGVLRGDRAGMLLPLGLGLGVVSILIFAFGLLGLFSSGGFIIAAILLASAVIGAGTFRIPAITMRQPGIIGVALLLLLVGGFLSCLYPEWYLDGLAWHLAIPERHLMEHKIIPLAHFMFSLFPMVGEMLYAAVLPFGGEEAAKLVNYSCGMAAAASACRLATVLGGGVILSPLIAALAYVSMPMMHLQMGVSFIDNIRTFLETLALIEVVRIWQGGRGSAVVAGSLMGLAFGVKYLSGWRAVILMMALALIPNMNRRRRAMAMGLFVAGAIITALPWIIRGWLDGNDPFYPMLTGWEGAFGFGKGEMAAWVQESRHFYAGNTTIYSWLALPWNFFIDLTVGRFGSYTMGPMPMVFGLLLLGFRGWTRPALLVLTVCVVEWMAWSVTSQVGRYIMPMFAALFGLAAWAASESRRAEKSISLVILLWACFSFVLGSNHRCNLYQSYGLGGYTTGRLSSGDMRTARGFGRQDMAGLPPGKLLLFGDIPPLGIGRTWEGASGFNHPLVKTWARESADRRRLAIKVRQAGVNGVVYSGKDAERHFNRAPGYALTPRESRLAGKWMASLRQVGTNQRFVFYAVPPAR